MNVKLLKVKKGKKSQWMAWCLLLMNQYKKEALETLKEENLSFEGAGLFTLGKQSYVLGMYEGDPLPTDMTKKLNQEHLSMRKECLEYVCDVYMAYEFSTKEL